MPRNAARHVVIDTKNLALFSGGIAAFVRPLIRGWLTQRPETRFSLVGPPFDTAAFADLRNWSHHVVPWPRRLPRRLRHPFYDNVLFPYAVSRLKPQFLFSPYHDVRLPPKRRVRSVIIVHDNCIDDLPRVYGTGYRAYYLAMLKRNLSRAAHVLTDSEASRSRIVERYALPPAMVTVVFNPVDPALAVGDLDQAMVTDVRGRYGAARLLFYPGGHDPRKNIGRLLDALAMLNADGEHCELLVTGDGGAAWDHELARQTSETRRRVRFLGRLPPRELRAHYAAADAVAYPSLCEGFGRVCLDAMVLGVPLACSDLPVFREIAGDYPVYFDPTRPEAIARGVRAAMRLGQRTPRLDPRFALENVLPQFTALMDRLLLEGEENG